MTSRAPIGAVWLTRRGKNMQQRPRSAGLRPSRLGSPSTQRRRPSASVHRSAQEVFAEHLRQRRSRSIEDDLTRNYAADVVVLTGRGIYRGHAGVRELARLLAEELPEAEFAYRTTLLAGEVAFLEWTALSAETAVEDGVDSFLIRDGLIVAQTIHYTVSRRAAPERP